jgi:pyruvate-ferredoxin/flavodoxin oxidoreductase
MAERRWFSRTDSAPPEFASGEAAPVLHSGLSALFELESIVSHGLCHDRSLAPLGADSGSTIVRPDGGSALTVAGGLAATGKRVACFVTASADVPLVDRLRALAERRVPLVVHAVVHGNADIERLCAAECMVAVARTPAHALDLALVARQAAEGSLTPAVIALDLTGVARSFEMLRPLPPELISRYLGAAEESVEAPTSAQRMLFGARRRRVP